MWTPLSIIIAAGVIAMAIRASTQAIIDRINALHPDDGIDQTTVDAAVAAANAEKQALIDADTAEDAEQVDAINAALDASPVTPNADGTPA